MPRLISLLLLVSGNSISTTFAWYSKATLPHCWSSASPASYWELCLDWDDQGNHPYWILSTHRAAQSIYSRNEGWVQAQHQISPGKKESHSDQLNCDFRNTRSSEQQEVSTSSETWSWPPTLKPSFWSSVISFATSAGSFPTWSPSEKNGWSTLSWAFRWIISKMTLIKTAFEVENEQSMNYGCMGVNSQTNEVVHYIEKPSSFVSNHINGGVYLLSTEVFDDISKIFAERVGTGTGSRKIQN